MVVTRLFSAGGRDFTNVQSGVSDVVVSVSWLVSSRSSHNVESDNVWMEDWNVYLYPKTCNFVSQEDG